MTRAGKRRRVGRVDRPTRGTSRWVYRLDPPDADYRYASFFFDSLPGLGRLYYSGWRTGRTAAPGAERPAGQGVRASADSLPSGPRTDRDRGDSMTQRDRPSPDHGSIAPARGPAIPDAPPSPLALSSFCASALWEQWYEQASPEQRRQ